MNLNTEKIYLQILTTGFKPRLDKAYAYGFLEVYPKDRNYSFSLLKNESDYAFLEERIDKWLCHSRKIYMFNGKAEWTIATKNKKNLYKFYHNSTIDLFLQAKKIDNLIHTSSLSLESLGKKAGFQGHVSLGPRIYEDHFPFTDSHYQKTQDLLLGNLEAMEKAHSYLSLIRKNMSQDLGKGIIQIEKIKYLGSNISIVGNMPAGEARFFHGENIYFEQEIDGSFTLDIEAQEAKYDESNTCLALPWPYPSKNPMPMPTSYLLIAMNRKIFLEQIFHIIAKIIEKL